MGQLDDIISMAPPEGWIANVPKLLALRGTYRLTGGESKSVENAFAAAVEAGDAETAIRFAVIGLGIDEARFFRAVRRRGYLRPSKYGFQTATLEFVADKLIECGLAATGTPIGNYLATLKALYAVTGEIRKIRDRLIAALDSGRERILKGMLATVDMYFMTAAWRDVVYGNRNRPSSDHQFFSAEQYAEGFSYAYFLHHERHGAWRENPAIDLEAVVGRQCLDLLVDAAHLRAFHEFETLIDVYGYTLREADPVSFRLEPPSENFERSLRLGFIQTQWQALANGLKNSNPDYLTLRQVGERLYQIAKGAYVVHMTSPVERYIFGLPDIEDLRGLLNEEDYFGEEIAYLDAACRSLLTEAPQLLAFEVAPGVPLRHLVRAQRAFALLRWYVAHHLMPILHKDQCRAGVVFQSLVPHMTIDQLRSLLSVVIDRSAVDVVVDLLTWNPDRDAIFDVQYQPLVSSDGGRLVPVNVFSELLAETLRRYFPQTAVGTDYDYVGIAGELDVVSLVGDVLLVNECKNPLLPTGPHEMRNSWEYIDKAVRQLDTLARLFLDSGFRAHLENRLGFSLAGVKRLATCIVMSNRMFTGYRAAAHPVRGLYEYVHFLKEGTTWIGSESTNFWAGADFAADDLFRYLDDDIVHRPQFDAMTPFELVYRFGRMEVRCASFKLEMDRLAERLGMPIATREIAEARQRTGRFVL